jgi:hypothetical protein
MTSEVILDDNGVKIVGSVLGLQIDKADQNGVIVDKVGADGFHVNDAVADGVMVGHAS